MWGTFLGSPSDATAGIGKAGEVEGLRRVLRDSGLTPRQGRRGSAISAL